MKMLLVMFVVMVVGLVAGVKLAGGAEGSYFDTATCADYLSVPRNERIQHNRELFRVALTNPGYLRVQLECAQNPSHLRRFESSIERMCRGRDNYLVRNAWNSAMEAHKAACNWR